MVCQDLTSIVRLVESDSDKEAAYRLRYRVFSQDLGWIPPSENCLDIDEYDECSIMLGSYNKNTSELQALIRITRGPNRFMSDDIFSECFGTHKIHRDHDSVDLTRLSVNVHNGHMTKSILKSVKLLFDGVYVWGDTNGVRFMYMVTNESLFRYLVRIGWMFKVMGSPVIFPPANVKSLGGLLDLKDMRN